MREFTEEAHCIALHPSGYNLLVGFTDKLRLFAVLLDTLKYALYTEHSSKRNAPLPV